MKRIYSNIDPSKLILTEIRRAELSEYRVDLSPDEEFLQVSGRKLNKDVRAPAHRHLPIDRSTDITQEAWIVLSGRIKGVFYDLNNEVLYETILKCGDCVVLYRGGHSLETLEEDTLFYEIKTGPYFGLEADKESI